MIEHKHTDVDQMANGSGLLLPSSDATFYDY